MSVSVWSGSTLAWERELSDLKTRLGSVMGRKELRETLSAFIDGLLSGVSRKTGWLMAEQAGLDRPWRMQALLGRSHWDADALRDEVRRYALDALADPSGVLIIDETGFVKKGTHSVGVGRQYSGTAGRIENSQIGVFMAYASRYGHTLIDRQLYLPDAWAKDEVRRSQAKVPPDAVFATKPTMAREMITRALDAGVPCAWVLADSVYGSDSQTRRLLESRDQPYVLAVRSTHTLRFVTDEGLLQTDPAELAEDLPAEDWHVHAAGEGAKGLRVYEWARISMTSTKPGYHSWVLVRRNRSDPKALAYYFAFAPEATSLAELAGAAGLRWAIEECFQRSKDDLGLDHCEARSWHGWHRHMTLVMATAAFLAKLTAQLRRAQSEVDAGKANERSPTGASAA